MDRLTKTFRQLDNRAVDLLERYGSWRIRHPKDSEGIRAWEKVLYEFFYTVGYDYEMVSNLCNRAKLSEVFRGNWMGAGLRAQVDWEEKKEREEKLRERERAGKVQRP